MDEDNVVVIRTPLRSTPNNNLYNIPSTPIHNNMNQHETTQTIFTPLQEETHHDHNDNDDFSSLPLISPQYTIQQNNIPNNKFNKNLPISKISLITINVLQTTYNHILKDILINKANKDLSQTQNNIHDLMYKIDLKIFINLINGVNKDFNDIKDINIANNELYTQFRKLIRLKRKLKNLILSTKQDIDNVKLLKNENTDNKDIIILSKRLKLNNDLNKLNRILKNKNTIPIDLLTPKNDNEIDSLIQNNNNNLLKITKICDYYDPYNGILSKLTSINSKLSK